MIAIRRLFLNVLLGSFFLSGCSPVKTPIATEYQLTAYSIKSYASKPKRLTLLVTTPYGVSGYQTNAMLYTRKPFQVASFAKNAWTAPPGDMLYPLLVQSLQRTGFFYAVASSPYTDGADYRLDTQVLKLQQSFIKRPSQIELSVKVVLTNVNDSKVIASKVININVPCPRDNPYGGVLAANQATYQFTAQVDAFVVNHIKQRLR